MNAQLGTTWWGRLSVGQKLTAIPLLFIVAIAGILYYTVVTARSQKTDAYVVHMSARQRMLNQRQLLQVLLVSTGHAPHPKADPGLDDMLVCTKSTDYLASRRLTKESLDALLNGGPILDLVTGKTQDVPAAPTPELKAKLAEQQTLFNRLVQMADQLLALQTDAPEYASTLQSLLDVSDQVEVNARTSTKMVAIHSQDKIATMIQQETLISALVAIVALVFSYIVTREIVNPLQKVVQLAQQVSQGDLRGAAIVNTSSDEVGQLARVFNTMLQSLRELTRQTVDVTANLNAASAEILASTQEQAAGTKEQAATIQEITATMEEVRQSGTQISERAKQVATAAEATSSSTVTGLSTIQESNRAMEAVRAQVEDVAKKIVALSEKTQAVGEIIATVNDIAERSNLLALNAAIEAAAAGEQGNRFSVVANEIKNLADQAKESTVQVRTILGDIQKGINSSVMLTEEAVKRADAGKQQADLAEQTIRRMADTTQQSVQAFQQIIGGTGQQQIGFEQVTQGMQDIRQAASQTAAGTLQLEKAVASLNAQSHQLREAVGRYQL